MNDLLKKYRNMRDFGVTSEPSGGKPKGTKLPIFVIQKHHASRLHYDFRLEMEGVLKSWAVPKGPSYDPANKRLAMMTEDHPYDYASFEGVIPAGQYGGGNVIIWDNGTWEFIEPGDDPVKAVRSGKLTFRMYGKKMFGEWALVKIHGRSGSKGNEWLLIKHRDEFANADVDVTELAPRSIISNLTVEEIGGSKRTWQSNRPASGTRTPTLAAKLEAEQKAEKKAKGSKKKTATSKTKRSPASRPARSAPAPKKAASARTRSSPAQSPRKAGTTPRRRPR
ncbi:MAG: bifunctional non-ous end joining protein LigD [Thermoanaerobaculia bacterium]|jgi:bifunctional non-homologous end joining protein LigD|nr:bifunctional non-ous end joining protein LigD [Thermoanaerobaculia bacterium]